MKAISDNCLVAKQYYVQMKKIVDSKGAVIVARSLNGLVELAKRQLQDYQKKIDLCYINIDNDKRKIRELYKMLEMLEN